MDATQKRHSRLFWKETLWVLIGLALAAGLVVGVLVLDEREDRARPLYRDVITMAGLQYDLLKSGEDGVEVAIDGDSGPVLIGDEWFEASPGVELVVEQRGDSYCVQGRNEYGDETEWNCVDGTGTRPDLGGLEED